jgi:hypothetical protein
MNEMVQFQYSLLPNEVRTNSFSPEIRMEVTDIYQYLRANAGELGSRILEMYPPLQNTTDEVPAKLSTLLRTALPAQAIAIGGLAKHLRNARAARIVAECGAGKTFMALGVAHVLKAQTILVMCPSHIAKKWAREAIKTIPFARTFLVEDMRNGGDPKLAHGICEVRLRRGRIVYEGMQLSLAELRQLGRDGWKQRCPQCSMFIIPKDKGKLSYFWRHAFLTAKCAPELGGVINPDTGCSVENPEGGRRTRLDFDQLKISEHVERQKTGTTLFSPLWQADRSKIQRMAPVEFIGRYMKGWFDLAIADELHQLAGDTAQGNALGVLARAGRRLIAVTGTLMGGYADDLFNVFYRMEPQMIAGDGFAYGGEGRRSFQEQYGILETIEKIREEDNACTRAPKKSVQVVRKPGASPLLFGKFLMSTTACPKLVETGLDLLAFPTLYFYQTGYSLHTLRQASRRSWRIGQRHPVRVKFLTYKGTMQEVCLRLMGRKMLVALMMEGKFSGEGLQSLDADEDLMSAMARELVEKAGVGESADKVWRQLDRERAKQVGSGALMSGDLAGDGTLAPVGAPALTSKGSIHLVDTGAEKKRQDTPPWPSTSATERPVQLSLFG